MQYQFTYFKETVKVLDALQARLQLYPHENMNKPNRERIFDNTSLSAGTLREASTTTHPGITDMFRSSPAFRPVTNLLHPDHSKAHSRSSSPAKSQHSSDTEDNEKEKFRHSPSLSGWITDHKPEVANVDDAQATKEKEEEAFRKEFSLPDENLSAVISGHLLRYVPLNGHVYLSDNYLCFKSRFNSTKLIVPLADIQSVDKDKGTVPFFHGLGLVTKTDQEVFFEFSSSVTRDMILKTIQDRTTPEAQKHRMNQRMQGMNETPSLELEDPMDSRAMDSSLLFEEPVHIGPFSHPGKPLPPMHITCLTIGSRGDVQPYIALCKRLMKDGHKCRISTHGEYKAWIEGHGIEFRLVGVSPWSFADLVQDHFSTR